MATYTDYPSALAAWQQAARQVRSLKAQMDDAETACANARATQQATANQMQNARQQMQDAMQDMLRLV